jgi:arylsulfatase A-like enzyme
MHASTPDLDARRPNVLLLFTDDQRFDTIAALNNPAIHTPHYDRLCHEGTACTHAHVMGSMVPAVCMPSRAMLHTGRLLFGVDVKPETLSPDHRLLGEHLRESGYETFGIGKWHNGPEAFNRSFAGGAEIALLGMDDHWNVPACDYHADGNYPQPRKVKVRHGKTFSQSGKRYDHVYSGFHSTELFTEAARDFLLDPARGERPWYCYVSFMAPHDPRETRRRFHAMYPPEKIDLPENFLPAHPFDNGTHQIRDEVLAASPRDGEEIRGHIGDYYAMISHLDEQIGRILDALEQTGQYDSTLIVLAGDNGLAVGQHGLMGKQSLYEHSTRVPLIFCGPGIPAGRTCPALCYLSDIYPTVCDLLGLGTPASVEAASLRPVLCDGGKPPREDLYLAYGHSDSPCRMRAVRTGRYKLIENEVPDGRITQLYDLVDDPRERSNLAVEAATAATVKSLRGRLSELHGRHGDRCAAFWEE